MPFILYRSSAGSGKTFTLVKEYLKIVLQKPDEFRHILAITFTNKAAAEMKERVMKYLKEITEITDNQSLAILDILTEELNLPRETLIKRAGQVMQLILHQFSDFSITTIDSFMHRVIRTFAHDLHLPVDFEVDLDNKLLVSQAVNNLVRQVGTDKELTKALVDLILNKSDEEKGWNVERDLEEIGNQLFIESGQLAVESFRREPLSIERARKLSLELRKLCKSYENKLKSLGQEALDIIENEQIPFSAFFNGEKGLPKYFSYIAEFRAEKFEPGSFVQKTIEEDKWYSNTTAPAFVAAINSIKGRLQDIYEKVSQSLEEEYRAYLSFKIVEQNVLPLAVLQLIDNELYKIKVEKNLLPIAEFNKRIADAIFNEPVPYIYERLGEWYHYYLLDEFQDTSVLQWLNLLPLVENSLASDYTSILVGDGKQAIYRWRNGDVEQFARLPEVYLPMDQQLPEERKLILKRSFHEKFLETNFRTAPEIVTFNNEFFTAVAPVLYTDHQPIYSSVKQKFREDYSGGYVSVEFFDKDDNGLSLKEVHLSRVLEILRSCREDAFNWKDIAVLCRTNAEASQVSRYLLNEGISVSSSESILLKNSPRVNVLIACLYLVNNPMDKVHAEVIKRFLTEENADQLSVERLSGNDYRGLPVYELSEKLIRDLGIHHKPDPFLIFFLDAVLQFSQKQDTSVSGFLDWWNDHRDVFSLKTPEDFDAVKVLTIHKAKGLEFEVVIYPFASESRSVKGTTWVSVDHPELKGLHTVMIPLVKNLTASLFSEVFAKEDHKVRLDFLNVLYVAMTRPRERLYVLTAAPGKDFQEGGRISDLFGIYLHSLGMDPHTTKTYIRGKAGKKAEKKAGKGSVFNFNYLHSEDWSQRISVRQNNPGDWEVQHPDKPRSTGNIIHGLLAKVNYRDDFEPVLESFRKTILDQKLMEEVSGIFNKILENKELQQFFNPEWEVRNEAEILTPDGKVLRPDRLVITPDKTLIIDYKSGAPQEYHRTQVRQYAEILNLAGFHAVESYLLYVDKEIQLQKVS